MKKVNITYFVHGTSTDNEKELASGWYDAPLSKLGEQQAKSLRNLLLGKKFDIVFCSDLKRAVQTAKIVFTGMVNIKKDARLRECNYGTYNAQPSTIVEPLQEKHIQKPFPEGESYEDVKRRVSEFFDTLNKQYCGKNIAVVAHKAPQLAIEVLINHKSWKEAFEHDWRKKDAWQPGWEYVLKC